MDRHSIRSHVFSSFLALLGVAAPGASRADGILLPPILPGGWLPQIWESHQEAIIIHDTEALGSRAVEDMIVKIRVQSLEDVETFAWVIPFPNPPEVATESPKVFEEIHRHVSERGHEDGQRQPRGQATEKREAPSPESGPQGAPTPERAELQEDGEAEASATPEAQEAAPGTRQPAPQDASKIQVISRRTVGSYDVAVVRALEKGALDAWLEKEGFRSREHEGKDVVESYRQKGYVFACVKVSDVKLAKDRTVELQPLRFTFETGGRDGVYFPMKMTGLQKEPFDLELHVFSPAPIDEDTSPYGYAHRGLLRRYRDENDNQASGALEEDRFRPASGSGRFLKGDASRFPSLAELFQRLRPGGEHHLTSIGTRGLRPQALESWPDDLWVFPRYSEAGFVPLDARPGGPAAAGCAKVSPPKAERLSRSEEDAPKRQPSGTYPLSGLPTRHVGIEAKDHGPRP